MLSCRVWRWTVSKASRERRRARKEAARWAKGKGPVATGMGAKDWSRGQDQMGFHYPGQFASQFDTRPPVAFTVAKGKDGLSAEDHGDGVTFSCDSEDILGECPIMGDNKPVVYVPKVMWDNWIALAKDNNTEWIAHLKGKLLEAKGREPKRWMISGMTFPPQTANGAHVDVDHGYEPEPGTIGAVHSHVGMQTFFSGEDMKHSNWDIEIVINNRGDYDAMVRIKYECGKFAKLKTKVFTVGNAASNRYTQQLGKAFAEGEVRDRARREKVAASGGGGYNGGGGGYVRHTPAMATGGSGSGYQPQHETGAQSGDQLPFHSSNFRCPVWRNGIQCSFKSGHSKDHWFEENRCNHWVGHDQCFKSKGHDGPCTFVGGKDVYFANDAPGNPPGTLAGVVIDMETGQVKETNGTEAIVATGQTREDADKEAQVDRELEGKGNIADGHGALDHDDLTVNPQDDPTCCSWCQGLGKREVDQGTCVGCGGTGKREDEIIMTERGWD